MALTHIISLGNTIVGVASTSTKESRLCRRAHHHRQLRQAHLRTADDLSSLNVHISGATAAAGLDLSGHAQMVSKQRGVSRQLRQEEGAPTINTIDNNNNGAKGSNDLDINSNHTHESFQFGFEADETWLEFCDDLPLEEEEEVSIVDQSLRLLLLQ
jgi:hypothetical protein